MSFKEYNFIQVLLLLLVTKIGEYRYSVYKKYVDSLGLKGDEKVLDFGSGSGAAAEYIARHLLKGNGRLTCDDMSRVWMKIIKKRIKKYHNVEFKLGDIAEVDIEAGSHDVVVVHLVLHDVEESIRPRTVNVLSRALKKTGKLYIKEPMWKRHGMPAEEIRELMTQSGLKEIDFKIFKSFASPPGPKCMGIFANA